MLCFLSSVDLFVEISFFEKKSGMPSECQTISILIRPDVLSGVIWVRLFTKVISRRQRLEFQNKFGTHCTYFVEYIFWGELIDKYKDINANSKTVFTDYAMLK